MAEQRVSRPGEVRGCARVGLADAKAGRCGKGRRMAVILAVVVSFVCLILFFSIFGDFAEVDYGGGDRVGDGAAAAVATVAVGLGLGTDVGEGCRRRNAGEGGG
ncbi:uncharacterized protein M6B38_177360 [Iris pallida]|uniref:Uncharacterized protein n=1 Tax=Iris pallida TaxID=29817 RepID=A0AAX6EPY4_IRIPA|nr:uncharacterized protein M6B38_177360 [Iris pallida]